MAASDNIRQKKVAVTGASGFLGGILTRSFLAKGWKVMDLGRRPCGIEGTDYQGFSLDRPPKPKLLAGVDVLVHCAWDFSQRDWESVQAVNVSGTRRLFDEALEEGVGSLILISTVSAAGEPRSMYGRAKRITEELALDRGGLVIRPGLLYGPGAAGMFGALTSLMAVIPIVPLPVGNDVPLYLAHQDDVSAFVVEEASRTSFAGERIVTAAAPDSHTLQDILEKVALSSGKRRVFFQVPWQVTFALLKMCEVCHFPIPIRSDSALSIATLDPDPFRTGPSAGALKFRSFKLEGLNSDSQGFSAN